MKISLPINFTGVVRMYSRKVLVHESHYKNGNYHGKYQEYYADGIKSYFAMYKNGDMYKYKIWFRAGKISRSGEKLENGSWKVSKWTSFGVHAYDYVVPAKGPRS